MEALSTSGIFKSYLFLNENTSDFQNQRNPIINLMSGSDRKCNNSKKLYSAHSALFIRTLFVQNNSVLRAEFTHFVSSLRNYKPVRQQRLRLAHHGLWPHRPELRTRTFLNSFICTLKKLIPHLPHPLPTKALAEAGGTPSLVCVSQTGTANANTLNRFEMQTKNPIPHLPHPSKHKQFQTLGCGICNAPHFSFPQIPNLLRALKGRLISARGEAPRSGKQQTKNIFTHSPHHSKTNTNQPFKCGSILHSPIHSFTHSLIS